MMHVNVSSPNSWRGKDASRRELLVRYSVVSGVLCLSLTASSFGLLLVGEISTAWSIWASIACVGAWVLAAAIIARMSRRRLLLAGFELSR